MSRVEVRLKKALLENVLRWFQSEFRQKRVGSIETQFPNFSLPQEIQVVVAKVEQLSRDIEMWPVDPVPVVQFVQKLSKGNTGLDALFKQIMLLYRRWRAANTEGLTEKTFHLELTKALEEEVRLLDDLVGEEWFQTIPALRLPRLKDFLAVHYIEAAGVNQLTLPPRQHDEKFHMLQTPNLFLPDLAYFRAKCEEREAPLAIAFIDIDNFKAFNTKHTETKVDRNLLPRFMQTLEAHVYHHGYAYRQGGDEYLILVPSLSKRLAIAFLDDLRQTLANLAYPEIADKTTVSIGLCFVEPDCPLTDRELRDRASLAKKFAKEHGKNCIATFEGPRFLQEELRVVTAQK